MMTKVIPRAAKISVPNCRMMLSKLAAVRNFGSTNDVTITSRAIATKIGLFLRKLMAACGLTRPSSRLSRCAHANSNALAMISSAEAVAGSNSPLIRPSQIVLTRLLMWRTSGSSDEIRMIEPPPSTIFFISR